MSTERPKGKSLKPLEALLPFIAPYKGRMIVALGALLAHITGGADAKSFQPMNVNFGLFPPLPEPTDKRKAKEGRKPALSARALADLERWLKTTWPVAA